MRDRPDALWETEVSMMHTHLDLEEEGMCSKCNNCTSEGDLTCALCGCSYHKGCVSATLLS